jgi:hypothetical protein
MRKSYTTGIDDNEISISVNIGTPGLANTIVFQFPGGGQKKKIAESTVDNGNITTKKIGKGSELKGSYLKVRTIIDFRSINPSQWEQLADNIVAKFTLSGGFSGTQHYSYDEDDKTVNSAGSLVVIDMEIDLI